jgi:hypothetical protein
VGVGRAFDDAAIGDPALRQVVGDAAADDTAADDDHLCAIGKGHDRRE